MLFKFFFSSALFLFSLSLAAQDKPFAGELEAKVNFCQIDGDNASGFNKFGYSVNYLVGQNLSESISYRIGLGFSNRGSRKPADPTNGIAGFHYDYNFIDVPVLVRLPVKKKFLLQAGLISSILLSAKDKERSSVNIKETSNNYQLLVCGGFSYQLKERVLFNAHYQYSVNSIYKPSSSPSVWRRNGVFHNIINVGFTFVISGK